jgi:hypothetical protein
VRDYVRARRRQIGMAGEAYVPQVHEPGAEAEVDWGEAIVSMRERPIEVGLFYLRACHSGAAYVAAFPAMTQQAFLEGHVEAFAYFGGVFGLIRYDNLTSAVKQVLRGGAGSSPIASWRCAATTASGRPSRSWALKAPTRRAASRVRSAATGAATWCRCRRLAPGPSWAS